LIGYPDDRQPTDQIASPVSKEQLVLHDGHEDCRDVVTEAILASKQVKELSLIPTTTCLTALFAVFARLAKNLLMRNRPRDTRHGNRQQKQFENLEAQLRHPIFGGAPILNSLRTSALAPP
jgi:hypothetical protein